MKYLLFVGLLLSNLVFARDVYVQPYTRSDGTYVQGHYRTAPDSTPYNNYSTQGNTNPYTGHRGYVQPNPYPSYQTPTYPTYQAPTNRGQSGICPYGQIC